MGIIGIVQDISQNRFINNMKNLKMAIESRELIVANENEIIAEPFLGSGTTMVASHQLNRKCYGMELEPKYCQVIIDRMKKLDPTLTIKRNGQII
jgi:DNA modification methylase